MRRRVFLRRTAVATALTGGLAGCSGDGGQGNGGTTTGGGNGDGNGDGTTTLPEPGATTTPQSDFEGPRFDLDGAEWAPKRHEISVGQTVQWWNPSNDSVKVKSTIFQGHEDVATEWDFEASLTIERAATYTFDEPGVYEFYDPLRNPVLSCGVVLAGDVSLDKPLPCADIV